MRLFEKNLKKIIKEIEKYGAVADVKILNSSKIIPTASPQSNPRPSRISLTLSKPRRVGLSFTNV